MAVMCSLGHERLEAASSVGKADILSECTARNSLKRQMQGMSVFWRGKAVAGKFNFWRDCAHHLLAR
eukprot:2228507-Pleurochrysis_carterae.AAC.1